MENKKMNTGIISRINFILLSILFSMFYWILESIRDVIIFNKGPLIERIFIPDTLSLWMRLLIVFILILFGAYVQSQKVKKEVKQNLILKFFGEIRVLWAGLVFGILYWLLEAIRDVFIFEKGNLFSRIFTPDPIGFWMRVLAVLVIILFSFYIQSVINARKNAELSLKKYKDDLESKVAERTKELNQSNELMQKEIAELKKMQTMEISKKVSILPDMYFKKSNFITKSSLQFIFNRYKMKSDTIKNSKIENLLTEFHTNIYLTSLIHSHLYQSKQLDKFNIGKYMIDSIKYLSSVFYNKIVTVNLNNNDIDIPVQHAVPSALISNELIINAYKHAFNENQKGTIEISLTCPKDKILAIKVADNGTGLPKKFDIDQLENTGLQWVCKLVKEQLNGEISFDRDQGTQITIQY